MPERTHCQRPDRDVPSLACGYPLPCPWHTIVVHGVTEALSLVLRGAAVAKVGEMDRARKKRPTPTRP